MSPSSSCTLSHCQVCAGGTKRILPMRRPAHNVQTSVHIPSSICTSMSLFGVRVAVERGEHPPHRGMRGSGISVKHLTDSPAYGSTQHVAFLPLSWAPISCSHT